MIFNKKADLGDHLMIFGFLFLVVVIAFGLMAGVYIYFGAEYDFRQVEADVLNYKIRECILSSEIDWNSADDFYDRCGFDKSVLEENNKIKVCKGVGDCISGASVFVLGSGFQECGFEAAEENKNFPRCSIRSLKKEGDSYEIITAGSQLRRVK